MSKTTIDRFWEKVTVNSPAECWAWAGYVDKSGNGYGQFWNGERLVKSHRFAYALANGDIPDGKVIDHTCHNDTDCTDVPCIHRACCNPSHLEAVSQSINSVRGRSGDHQSAKTHCRAGHEYTAANTILRNAGRHRVCRECFRQSQIRYNAKRRAA